MKGERFGPSEISHEKSRSQYLARTGFRGEGQSRSFKYGGKNGFSAATRDFAYPTSQSHPLASTIAQLDESSCVLDECKMWWLKLRVCEDKKFEVPVVGCCVRGGHCMVSFTVSNMIVAHFVIEWA